jgi:hypothetical protein
VTRYIAAAISTAAGIAALFCSAQVYAGVACAKAGDAFICTPVSDWTPAVHSSSGWPVPSTINPPVPSDRGSGGTARSEHNASQPAKPDCWSCGDSKSSSSSSSSSSNKPAPYKEPESYDPYKNYNGPDLDATFAKWAAERQAQAQGMTAIAMAAMVVWGKQREAYLQSYSKELADTNALSKSETEKAAGAIATVVASLNETDLSITNRAISITPPVLDALWKPISVTDPSAGYVFHTDSQFGRDANIVHDVLVRTVPHNSREELARTIGIREAVRADTLYADGDTELAKGFLEAAKMSLDISLGFIPVVGWARDTYEAISGRSLILGTPLDRVGRGLALFGALTLGFSDEVLSAPSKLSKLLGEFRSLATAKAEFDGSAKVAEGLIENLRAVEPFSPIHPGPLSAIRVAEGSETTVAETYRSATYVEVKTVKPIRLYRSYSSEERKFSSYWTTIKPSGPSQGVLDSALDPSRMIGRNKATRWVEIEVPKDNTVFIGIAGPVQNLDWGVSLTAGGPQVFIEKVSPDWIQSTGNFFKP